MGKWLVMLCSLPRKMTKPQSQRKLRSSKESWISLSHFWRLERWEWRSFENNRLLVINQKSAWESFKNPKLKESPSRFKLNSFYFSSVSGLGVFKSDQKKPKNGKEIQQCLIETRAKATTELERWKTNWLMSQNELHQLSQSPLADE